MKSIFAIVISCLVCFAAGAQSSGRLIKEGDDYFDQKMYRSALQYYKQGGNAMTWDKDVKLRAAICRYEVNDIDGAISLLNALVEEGKTDPLVFFYLGRSYHHREAYKNAVRNYKLYIRRAKADDPRREWTKDEILKCASGNNLRYATPMAYVENLGTAVNTFYDETGPVPSPSVMDRLYYSSARPESTGGAYRNDGIKDPKFGSFRSDLFYSEHTNGVWRSSEQMDAQLNTDQHELLFGFSADGQNLYYFRGESPLFGNIIVDTFSSEANITVERPSLGAFVPANGDRDLLMFNDTIMLFSSAKAGGFGGYDLYYSVFRDSGWDAATNLGPEINSHYDDVSPFLARNGRLLYFSSNRTASIGGFDIFHSHFDDQQTKWSAPENTGPSVNSPGNDVHYRIAADGLTAYFASDRKTGYGMYDLYAAYMKEAVVEHLTISAPTTFAQIKPLAPDVIAANAPVKPAEIKEFYIGDFLVEDNDLVLTPQNIKTLDVIANLLLIFPTVTADLICHDIPSGPRSFDLYFSIKKAEQAAQYLTRKGVPAERLFVMGCGSFYPRATDNTSTANNPAVNRLNRRIEVRIRNTEDQRISLIYAQPNIPTELIDPRGARFSEDREGLIYRVQIASVNQMFQHPVFDDQDHALVLLDQATRQYQYYVGMEYTTRGIIRLREKLAGQGFEDPRVVAFLHGRQLDRAQIPDHTEAYPDLLNYLELQD